MSETVAYITFLKPFLSKCAFPSPLTGVQWVSDMPNHRKGMGDIV
jgi:hypothetical protein